MKCAINNCPTESLWIYHSGGDEMHMCDQHYRTMAKQIVSTVYNNEAGGLFGRAMDRATETKDEVFEAIPNPETVAPNVTIAIAQAILAVSQIFKKHSLSKVQQAVTANAIARVILVVAKEAHRDAVINN